MIKNGTDNPESLAAWTALIEEAEQWGTELLAWSGLEERYLDFINGAMEKIDMVATQMIKDQSLPLGAERALVNWRTGLKRGYDRMQRKLEAEKAALLELKTA